MRSISGKGSLALVAACMLAACSGDSATGVQPSSTLDAAWTQLALPSVSGLVSSVVGMPSIAQLGGDVPPACTYSTASSSFTCATTTANGLTFTRGYSLFDANGVAQSAFDAKATASIQTTGTVKGTVTGLQGNNNPVTIDESQVLTLSGLLGSERVINGTSSGKIVSAVMVNGASQTVAITETTTYNKITIPAAATSSTYPTSGSITSDLATTIGSDIVHTQLAMTFNGTSKVTVVLTVGGHSSTCIMDSAGPGFVCS